MSISVLMFVLPYGVRISVCFLFSRPVFLRYLFCKFSTGMLCVQPISVALCDNINLHFKMVVGFIRLFG